MEASIKTILTEHSIQDPKLLTDLNQLYIKSIKGAKQFGKKSMQLPPGEEDLQYDRLINIIKECVDSEGSIFALQNLDSFCEQYGLYRKATLTVINNCPF